MKTEIVLFVNQKGFKEYAVRYKMNLFSKWEYVKEFGDRNALFKLQDAVSVKERLEKGGEVK